MAAVIGFSFKERFLRFQLLFPDFYHFHHVVRGMKGAKKIKTKNGQNMSSGPFSHDAAHLTLRRSIVRIPSRQWPISASAFQGLLDLVILISVFSELLGKLV